MKSIRARELDFKRHGVAVPARLETRSKNHAGAALIVLIWMVAGALLLWWLLPRSAG